MLMPESVRDAVVARTAALTPEERRALETALAGFSAWISGRKRYHGGLRRSLEGGLSSIVSSTTVHNEILAQHPEYLGLLYNGYYYIRREAALTERGVSVVSLTDSAFSPLAECSKIWFEVLEADHAGFRSLSASMAFAMALTVGVAEARRQKSSH